MILPLILYKKTSYSFFKVIGLIFLLSISINIPQKMISNKYYQSDYLIITTFEPLQYILNSLPPDDPILIKETKNIEKIIPLEYIKNYGQHSYFEYNYEQNGFATVSNKSDQKKYLVSVSKLFLHHYKLFLKCKINFFTSVFLGKTYYPTTPLYSLRVEYYFEKKYNDLIQYSTDKYHLKPIPEEVNTKKQLIIPFIVLLLGTIVALILRKKQFLIYLLPIMKIPIIILFAPSCSFMYFYYLYIIGYIVLVYAMVKISYKIKSDQPIQ